MKHNYNTEHLIFLTILSYKIRWAYHKKIRLSYPKHKIVLSGVDFVIYVNFDPKSEEAVSNVQIYILEDEESIIVDVF